MQNHNMNYQIISKTRYYNDIQNIAMTITSMCTDAIDGYCNKEQFVQELERRLQVINDKLNILKEVK